MIEFLKSQIDDDVRRLLAYLEPNYPSDKVILEIEKNFASAVKVILDKQLIGLLILKRFVSYDGKNVLVVEHGVAQDNMRAQFSALLDNTIFAYAFKMGFDEVQQHADTKALIRLFEKYYGEPQECIFKKDLKEWAKVHPHLAQARQPHQQA